MADDVVDPAACLHERYRLTWKAIDRDADLGDGMLRLLYVVSCNECGSAWVPEIVSLCGLTVSVKYSIVPAMAAPPASTVM